MSYSDRLKKMAKNAQSQMETYNPNSFGAIPDDTYQMRVTAALGETKKKPERLMITFKFIIAEGDFEGRQNFQNCVIEGESPVGLHIARRTIEELGYTWPENENDYPELENTLNEITDKAPLCTVQVTTGKNGNQYFNIKETEESISDSEENEEIAEPEVIEETPTDENQMKLIDFCAAQGIEGIENTMTCEEIISAFKENSFTFKSNELTDDEIAMFESLNAKELIEYPEVKTHSTKKPIVKKKK